MKPIDTLQILQQMLLDAGFDRLFPSPSLAWRVFQKYIEIPVVCDNDTAFFQAGDFSTDGNAYFDFCREFCLRVDNNVVWYEQVHLEFTRAAFPGWGRAGVQRWANKYPNRVVFIREVESLAGFQASIALSEWCCNVYHTGV